MYDIGMWDGKQIVSLLSANDSVTEMKGLSPIHEPTNRKDPFAVTYLSAYTLGSPTPRECYNSTSRLRDMMLGRVFRGGCHDSHTRELSLNLGSSVMLNDPVKENADLLVLA